MVDDSDERIKKIEAALTVEGIRFASPLIYGIRIRMYAHTFYNILFRIPFNSILWSSPYAVSLTHSVV
jgi:hypothetical protein